MQLSSRGCLKGLVPELRFSLPTAQHLVAGRISLCVRANGSANEDSSNPLEMLRGTRDINKRCALIQQLDSGWREAHEQYRPSPAEECVIKELGLWKQTVMYVAVQTELASLDPHTQVKPAIKCLKQANLEPQDIWLLLSKRMYLFKDPIQLQRWLDFLSGVLSLGTRELLNFFLGAPEALLTAHTIHSASQVCVAATPSTHAIHARHHAGSQVVRYLKEGLGIRDGQVLSSRVLSIAPSVLMRSVEQDLKPTVALLTELGVEVSDIQGLVCMWPGLLLANASTQLEPWVAYMQMELGCSRAQVGEIIVASPHFLGISASSLYGDKVRALQSMGISKQDLHSITSRATMWLMAASNVQELLAFLLERAGFSRDQVRSLVLAAPGLLSMKLVDLERKWAWLEQVGASRADVLACPKVLEAGLVSTLSPRHGFLSRCPPPLPEEAGVQGLEQMPSNTHMAGRGGKPPQVPLPALVEPMEDGPWCVQNGVGLKDYQNFRVQVEEQYLASMTRSSAQEFQDELKKLGVYEGE